MLFKFSRKAQLELVQPEIQKLIRLLKMPKIERGTVSDSHCRLICLAATHACSSAHLAWEYALCTSDGGPLGQHMEDVHVHLNVSDVLGWYNTSALT